MVYVQIVACCQYGFWGTKKAPVRVLMNKKTISNTHFSMGKFALQSQKCANFVTGDVATE